MPARVVCLSPYSKKQVEDLFAGGHAVDVMTVPAPPAPEAVLEECAVADLVIADKRHAHRLPRGVLERMTRCLLIQMPAVGMTSSITSPRRSLGLRSRTLPATTATP